MDLVWHIITAIVFFTGCGYFLDQKLHQPFVFTIIGGVLGMIYTIVLSYRILNKK